MGFYIKSLEDIEGVLSQSIFTDGTKSLRSGSKSWSFHLSWRKYKEHELKYSITYI